MHHSEAEKIALEHQAAKLFMRCYERNTGKRIVSALKSAFLSFNLFCVVVNDLVVIIHR
ncbi:hypothetical protein J8N69_01015 [Marinomonas profundi]|uniref:hypothetical protein n=1 Tax=Marinomonas profundi TaxID=2726122 RepID=UPI001D11579B|nr:hypothetical protein [Marinomonas profundi]UDV04923.1 hypothetical protein J8N69_01015 [Marinomonas profundi]